jgi:hypothetical protein
MNLDGVVVLVLSINGKAQRADQSLVATVGINAHKGWVLIVMTAVMGANELLESLAKGIEVLLHIYLSYSLDVRG